MRKRASTTSNKNTDPKTHQPEHEVSCWGLHAQIPFSDTSGLQEESLQTLSS